MSISKIYIKLFAIKIYVYNDNHIYFGFIYMQIFENYIFSFHLQHSLWNKCILPNKFIQSFRIYETNIKNEKTLKLNQQIKIDPSKALKNTNLKRKIHSIKAVETDFYEIFTFQLFAINSLQIGKIL